MEDILELLISDPSKAINTIEKQTAKTADKIEEYRKEFTEHDRLVRNSQVGNTQKDRMVKGKLIKEVRIPINFAKKIVTTSTAFEVGAPVTLVPSIQNKVADIVKQLWKVNRTDSLVKKLVGFCKQESQSAVQLYINDVSENSLVNKIAVGLGLKTQAKEIKTLLLQNDKGQMYPYFDGIGNMILFMWKYSTKEGDKTINNVKIWDKEKMHFFSEVEGKFEQVEKYPMAHGFDRIPIVYKSQDEPEWFVVREMIDRLETCISKLASSNDRIAYPIMKTFGKIASMPDKDDNGKVLNFPMIKDDEGKYHHGDAEFLESKGAAVSQKLELEKLEEYIFSISQTPNLAFDNIKGLGDVSGVALKLMFLDAYIKAAMNEGENRTMIERILNVYISGIVTTTNTNLKSEGAALYYEILFNSILPNDLKEAVEIASLAKASGLMSAKTGVEYLDMTEDSEAELEAIKAEKPAIDPVDPVVK